MEIAAKKKRASRFEYDRLSSLPDSLLHHILSFLDMKHVVLIGSLSRRWRHLSNSISNLYFRSPRDDDDRDNFVKFVDRALLMNSAPRIQKFRLWFQCYENYVSHVDAWIRYATEKGVQELDLDFPRKSHGCSPYKLPFWLLSCKTLISLKLKNCSFGAFNFESPANLTALSLSCEVLKVDTIEDVLKGCPALEDLVVRGFFFGSSIKIRSSSSSSLQLKRLTIEGCHNKRVEVEAPNLQVLKISIGCLGECFLEDMPFLRDAHIDDIYPLGSKSECIASLESSILNLRHARVLKLCSTCIQVCLIYIYIFYFL